MSRMPLLRRWLYRLAIPCIWLPVALISWRYPGDEYGLFVIANGLPGAWLSIWMNFQGSPNDIFPVMLAISLGSVFLIAWLMDWLRLPVWLVLSFYAIAAAVLFWTAYGSYESHARAISKNGSLTAYVSASSNLGLFLACMTAIIFTVGYHAVRRFFSVRSTSDGVRPQP